MRSEASVTLFCNRPICSTRLSLRGLLGTLRGLLGTRYAAEDRSNCVPNK